jgi:L-seryl-tRNA(Ser) seleniumtransferase
VEPDRPVSHAPSVDSLARSIVDVGIPHALLVDAARAAIASSDPSSARALAVQRRRTLLRPVINATGVLLHTNLGRAPVEMHNAPRAFNVEFDLQTGQRSAVRGQAASLLARAMGAEDAFVVNNGAAAILLVLAALAHDRSVVVSRGELVEIGGGFRIPEVLAVSGSRLVEVGTTNRTRRSDYEAAIAADNDVALLLKVHQSNYRIIGFTESVEVAELTPLGVPVVADIGSGLLDADVPWLVGDPPAWLRTEPAARQTLEAGAVLVTFSGDKLLGGPQAGIIAGSAELVALCARHPLARALRPGALVLGALEATALAYLRKDGEGIPFWRMASAPVEKLRDRATVIAKSSRADVVDCMSVAGGGSVPGLEIPSAGVALSGDRTEALRLSQPPIIARIHAGMTLCDLRSVDPADDGALATALTRLDQGEDLSV